MRMWVIIIFSGLITVGIRLSFILLLDRINIPDWFRRSLRYVPAAVLTAILVPELTTWNEKMDLTWHNPQILAGIVAILVAWRTRNVFITLLSGMVVYLGLILLIK
jgi:branched-subunit amino acid transport protein